MTDIGGTRKNVNAARMAQMEVFASKQPGFEACEK